MLYDEWVKEHTNCQSSMSVISASRPIAAHIANKVIKDAITSILLEVYLYDGRYK